MAENISLDQRVDELAKQLDYLNQRVDELSARLETRGAAIPSPIPVQAPATPPKITADTGEREDVSEELISWAHKASLLPRLSTLCFLLVIALALRTITDNDMINKLLGSALGMGYAAVLIAVGWYRYRQGSPLAPVFAACGAVLMSTIVLETHTRFQSLPLVPAYITLMATGASMAFISYRFHSFIPISLGTLGMCLAGAAIDYPNPYFPYLSMVLWTANILAYFAARFKRCSWLRWTVLAVTMMMLVQWGFKLGMKLFAKETPPPNLAAGWFLPLVAAFTITYSAMALLGILRARTEKTTRFDFLVPSVNVAFTFSIAFYVVSAWGASRLLLGWVGIGYAFLHLGVAFWLSRQEMSEKSGTNSFILAALVLLAISLPGATGSFLLSLPALAVTAFFLIIMSRQWQNDGTRVISYLAQLYPPVAMVFILQTGTAAVDMLTVIPTGLMSIASFFHYQLARRYPPPGTTGFFTRFDRNDQSAVLLLIAALASSFFAVRVIVYQLLHMMPGDIAISFRCAQSMLINIAAAGLMIIALQHRNREIRNVAILVTLVGAIKVFLYDMMGTQGLPLVLSVFTFGLVAALESIVLGRWSKQPSFPNVVEVGGGKPNP